MRVEIYIALVIFYAAFDKRNRQIIYFYSIAAIPFL